MINDWEKQLEVKNYIIRNVHPKHYPMMIAGMLCQTFYHIRDVKDAKKIIDEWNKIYEKEVNK